MKRPFLYVAILLLPALSALAQAPGSGYALDFAASSDYTSVPDNSALNPTTALTVEAWIKADSWSPNSWGNVIISKDGWGAGEAGYSLRCGANGTLSFLIGTTTSWREALSTPQMALNTWYHVAGTFDGTQLKIYINGMLSGTTNYTGVMLASTYALAFGRITYTAGGTRNFDGQIDEVRVWNTAVPEASLREYMTKKVTSSHPQYANLAGYWKLDEGTGATIADSGPNNLSGTRNGTTWGLSAAAIGDDNAYSYTSPSTVTLTNADGSTFAAQVTAGNPSAVHVYAVHQTPNSVTENLSGALETTHYFGTYIVGGTTPRYSVTYNYSGVAGLAASAQEQNIRLAGRSNNSTSSWVRQNNQFHLDTLTNETFRCGLVGRREFAAGFDTVRYNLSTQALCQGDSFLYFGQTITQAGTFTHSTTNPNGCDSIVGVAVTMLNTAQGNDSATICSGDTVWLGSTPATSTGIYTQVLNAANGCDSVVTFNLTVNPAPVNNIADTICDGSVYMLGTQTLTQAGIFSETFSTVGGCDSVVTLTLSVEFVDTSVTTVGNTISANFTGGTYQWLVCTGGFNAIPGQTSQSFSPGSNGNYAVVVSNGTCSDTSSCHFVLAVGIENGPAIGYQVYPNPTVDLLHIEALGQNTLEHVQLLNLSGQTLLNLNGTGERSMVLSTQGLAKGLYFLMLGDGQNRQVLKVQVQ